MRSSQIAQRYEANRYSTVSPLRLRWLLLQRACETAEGLSRAWSSQPPLADGSHALLLRDLLGELLSGLTHGGGAVAEQMADVYVFLLQHLTRAERTLNPQLLRDIQRVLIIECETWRQVVERHTEHRDPAESTPIVTGSGQGGLALSDARLSVHA